LGCVVFEMATSTPSEKPLCDGEVKRTRLA
jgi:hypothetical protein